MTKKELQKKIKESGLKKGFLAKKLNMNRQTLGRKLHGHNPVWFSPAQMEIVLTLIKNIPLPWE